MEDAAAIVLGAVAVATAVGARLVLRLRRASSAGPGGPGGDPAAHGARPRTRSTGPLRPSGTGGGFFGPDVEGLPLSRDFLPEDGDPPPLTEDVFAELARRRVHGRDG